MALPLLAGKFRGFSNAGVPLNGGKLESYVAASATPRATYTSNSLAVANPNPVILDANGEADIWVDPALAYKFILKDSLGNVQWTEDNYTLGGAGGSSTTGSEWVASGVVPVFIAANSFSAPGDQTGLFTLKRRLKSAVTAGTAYSTVLTSLFAAGNTTVTVLNDVNSALDAGLSVVSVGILDPSHPSIPNISNFFRKNFLTNGAMLVSQRLVANAVTLAAAAGYTLDRWQGKSGAGGSAIFQQVGTVGLVDGFPSAIQVQRTPANAAVTLIQLAQSIESADATPMANQFVALSFKARAGGNYSAAGGLLTASVIGGTGNDQNVLTGYAGAVTPLTANVVLTGLWQQFQIVGLIPAGITEVGVVFSMTPVGVAGAADFFQVTAVQLEVSNAATDFDHRPFGDILARCQRYYQKTFPYATVPAQNSAVLGGAATCFAKRAGALGDGIVVSFPVGMRIAPAITSYNPNAANVQARDTSAAADCAALAFLNNSTAGFQMSLIANAATAINNLLQVHLSMDAEL